MEKIKISVVTVCYNAVDTVEATIQSVINQTYDNVEYIIIDGGSTDGTVEIIKKYADKLAYWVSEPDKGIYDAMNKGIAVATGDYINFMNAGDRFADNEVLKFIEFDADVIYGRALYLYKSFKLLFIPQNLDKINQCFPIYHQASFVRVEILKNRLFNISYRCCADYDLFYELYHQDVKFKEVPITICMFEAEDGLSSTNIRLQMVETSRINGSKSKSLTRLKIEYTIFKNGLKKMFLRIFPSLARTIKRKSLLKKEYIFPPI